MSRANGLIKNTFIFALGSFGSKLLQFLLLPLYTRLLTDAQYGTVDILQNLGILLIPIVSLTVAEGVFRFALDNSSDNRDVFTIGMRVVSIGTVILLLAGCLMYGVGFYSSYVWIVVFYTLSQIFRTIASQFVRAIGKVKLFTIDNLLQTLLIILFNILFLTVFDMGVKGYMLGYILGNSVSFLFLFVVATLWKYLKRRIGNKSTVKEILRYSIPLIPNAICWWIISTIGRFMVTGYLGVDANGVYAVANKIPTIVTLIMQVFFQAWQISASCEFEKSDYAEYSSRIFRTFESLAFTLTGFIITFSKFFIMLLGSGFRGAQEFIPVLLVGTVFFNLAQFHGVSYVASKNTIMAFVTNLITAVLNIVLNIILIPHFGVMGAAISLMVSYLVFWLIRLIDTRRITKIKYPWQNLLANLFLTIAMATVATLQMASWLWISLSLFIVMVVINFNTLFSILKRVMGMLFKSRRAT